MVLIILCGIPCAGKSEFAVTLARELELTHGLYTIVVDPDKIRQMIPALTTRFDPEREPFVNYLALTLVEQSLGNNRIVISDDLNYYESTRHKLIQIARKHRVEYIILYLTVSIETAQERNASRGTPIPQELIPNIAGKLDYPGAKYEWDKPALVLDSEKLTSEQLVKQAIELVLDKVREESKKVGAKSRNPVRPRRKRTEASIRMSLDASTRKVLNHLFSSGELDARMTKEASRMRRAFIDEVTRKRMSKEEALSVFKRRVREQFA